MKLQRKHFIWVAAIALALIVVAVIGHRAAEKQRRERTEITVAHLLAESKAKALTPETESTAMEDWETRFPTAAAALADYVTNFSRSSDPAVTDVEVARAYAAWETTYPVAARFKDQALARDVAMFIETDFPDAAAAVRDLQTRYPRQTREVFFEMDHTGSPATRAKYLEWAAMESNLEFVQAYRSMLFEHAILYDLSVSDLCGLLYDECSAP